MNNKRYIIPKRLTKNYEVFDGITRGDLLFVSICVIIGVLSLLYLKNKGLPLAVWLGVGGFILAIGVMMVIPLGDGMNIRRHLIRIRLYFKKQQQFLYLYQSNYENLDTFKKSLEVNKIKGSDNYEF